jgi:ribosomal protein L11 methylase PrmA
LHAKSQARFADAARNATKAPGRFSQRAFEGLLTSLESAVSGLSWQPKGVWADYYDSTNYSDAAMQHKLTQVAEYIKKVAPKTVWDLGANMGNFSRAASEQGITTIAFDMDAGAVEKNYRRTVEKKESSLLPLVLDLTNPTPALGWRHSERMSLAERGPADLALALALVHHLAIGNNTPLESVAACFGGLAENLVIEFVPKSDSQVQRMLASRKDIFDGYTKERFEESFRRHFVIEHATPLADSGRVLYLMKKI